MGTFDAQFRKLTAYLDAVRTSGPRLQSFTAPCEGLTEGLPVRVGPGANAKIILRGDTFVELGNPAVGSCAFVLWTNATSVIRNARITVIGPDIQESAGASLPFGQVILAGGRDLGPDAHQALNQAQYVADWVEGYMVRSSSRHIWSRVSNAAAAKGFGFETLGRALMTIFRSKVPQIETMETVFITASRDDVVGLNDIATETRDIGADLVKEHWKARGYDLDCDLDCRSCHDKDVCDDVRKIIAARLRKEREGAASPGTQVPG